MYEAALRLLEARNERYGIVECRLFAGMSIETASALGVSPATVKRDWGWCGRGCTGS